jgi:hypothetical protein
MTKTESKKVKFSATTTRPLLDENGESNDVWGSLTSEKKEFDVRLNDKVVGKCLSIEMTKTGEMFVVIEVDKKDILGLADFKNSVSCGAGKKRSKKL